MLNNLLPREAFTIAKYTFKEILKSKILLSTFFIACILVFTSFIAYSFTYGDPTKVATDMGLGLLSISTVGIAVFIGVGILSSEVESRTVYLIISRPVSRSSFLIGKKIGLLCALALNFTILSFIVLGIIYIIGNKIPELIFWAMTFIFLEGVLVFFVITLISLITNKVLSIILTLIIYICGHTIDGVLELSLVKKNIMLNKIVNLYQYILPGFYKLNLKNYVLYGQKIPGDYLFHSTLYGVTYITLLGLITLKVFNNKSLD